MVMCAIIGCSKNRNRDKTSRFFNLPTIITNQCAKTLRLTTARRGAWLSRISRDGMNLKYTRVCDRHFVQGQPSHLFDETNPDWAPSLYLGHEKMRTSANPNKRHSRLVQRKLNTTSEALTIEGTVNQDVQMQNEEENHSYDHPVISTNSVECQTDSTIDCRTEYIASLEKECQALRAELAELKKRFIDEVDFDQESLKSNDEKVRFYTGLPSYVLLLVVYNFLADHIPDSHRNALPKFKEFVLVLVRLRLNVPLQDLAYRFKISQSTVSRIFCKWLDVMYQRLSPLIQWPDRTVLQTSMPTSFKKAFGENIAVIIDCFEVFIDKPTSLMARAQTWSQDKHHNTVKFLIGITPQGSISFISEAWGGRTSDKYLTERSGLLEKLQPGDVVMADRGFDIADTLGFVCAKLLMPSFTRHKSQLSMMDVESTRKIANLRIHVERVIGLVRMKYSILNGILPIECLTSKPGTTPQIDKIAVVCCGLCNICPCVVPSS